METRRLFDEDAYQKEFDATVLVVNPTDEGDTYLVELDATAFFPEEGGQSPDTGVLGGGEVLDVQIKQGIITHRVKFETAVPAVGDSIHGRIDWDHRYSNMQNHTGEHIFSGIVHRLYGYENVGFHLSDRIVTMDYNGVLSEEDCRKIEEAANEVIYQNLPVLCEYPDADTLSKITYRSKKELEGDIRIVTIPDVDVCACCAPHVHRTGEVGMLKVLSVQKYKGGVRLEIRCGRRARAHYEETLQQLLGVSRQLSAGIEQIPEYIQRLQNQNRQMAAKLREVYGQKLRADVEAVPPMWKHVFLFASDVDNHQMRDAVNTLVEKHEGFCGVFLRTAEDSFAYIIGSSSLDSREVGNVLREQFGAKGGGKPEMIQGSVAEITEETLVNCLTTQYPIQ